MRRFAFIFVLFVAVVAMVAGTAFASRGNSSAHDNRGQAKKAAATASPGPDGSNHDTSNPDGTYRGKSSSTPDQDGIGADHGIVNNDKTGPGTDGNNGCGNDPDREDDDNGWCGNKPAHVKPTPTPTETGTATPTVTPTVTPRSGGTNTEVLGESFTRSPKVAGRSLARTGLEIMLFALAAMGLGFFGLALRAIARPRSSN